MGVPLAPALRPFVAALVAYDVDLGRPGVHRGLPSSTLTFVLPVGEPLAVRWGGDTDDPTAYAANVAGLHTAPAEIHHDGTQRGVQLALTTAGARALLGLPAAPLAGELLELADVSPALRHLPELLHDAPAERWSAVVQRELVAALARHDTERRPRPEVGRALARLTRGARVAEVADEVGLSRRHLGTLVRDECGVAPKQVHRLGRFERSRQLLGHRELADVAATCGYADQAHLTREWRALAGCTPTTWLREEFPFVQDPEPVDAAG